MFLPENAGAASAKRSRRLVVVEWAGTWRGDETIDFASGIDKQSLGDVIRRDGRGRACSSSKARRMIELRELQKVFPGPDRKDVVAVTGVNLVVESGETVALIGTSGCGKTTTLKMINRLIDPTGGQVLLNGKDVRETNLIKLRRNIGYVVQRGGLFPHMTVARNVALLCHLDKWPREKTRARANELLEMVNLSPDRYANRYPHELSGGQRLAWRASSRPSQVSRSWRS